MKGTKSLEKAQATFVHAYFLFWFPYVEDYTTDRFRGLCIEALLKNPFRVQACNRWPGGLRSPLLDHLVTQHDLRVRANTFVEGLELSDDQQRITGLRCRSRGQTTEFLEESWLWKFYI